MEKPHSYWETVFVLGNRVPIGKPNSYWEIVFILGPLTRTLERQVRYQDVVVGVVHLAAPDGVPDHVQELRDAVLSHVAKVRVGRRARNLLCMVCGGGLGCTVCYVPFASR